MLDRLTHLMGGYPLRQRDLRMLYAVIFLSGLGGSFTFWLRLLYAQAHGASPTQLGIMAASYIAAPLLTQVPMGWLVDRWGRVPMLIAALIGHAVVSLLFVLVVSPVALIALRFLEGVAMSAMQPAERAYITDVTPESHRSEAFSVLNAAVSGGELIGPLLGGLTAQQFGFRTAFIVNVAIEVVALFLVWGRLREPAVHRHAIDAVRAGWRQLVTIPLIGAYAATFSFQVVFGMFIAVWSIWLHTIGASLTYIGSTLTVFALPQLFFSAYAGRAVDRWGRAPVLAIGSTLLAAIYVIYGFTTSLWIILLLGILEGIVFMFVMPAGQSLLADASPPVARGRAQGVSGAVGGLGGAIAAFASLPLYHVARPLPFVGTGVVIFLGSCVAALGAVTLRRRTARMASAGSASPAE